MIGNRRRNRVSRLEVWLLLVVGPALWWSFGPRPEAPEPATPVSAVSSGPARDGAPERGRSARSKHPPAVVPPRSLQREVLDAARSSAGEALPHWLERALGERVRAGEPLVSNRAPISGGDLPFDPRDLAALTELIDANGLGEASSRSDFDDGDGRFDPWELGYQVWQAGRLVSLSLGPDPHASFGYEIAVVPEAIGDLGALVHLDLSGNRIESLPASLGDLQALSELRVNRNQLGELPASLGELRGLRSLNVSQNRLRGLPDETRGLESLADLYLDDNPISELPGPLQELDSLERVSVTHEAEGVRAGLETEGGLATLPRDWLTARDRPLVLVVGGNRLCDPMLVGDLATAEGAQVFGLSAQRCAEFASR